MNYLTLGACIGLYVAALVYIQTAHPSPYFASLAVWAAWILSFAATEIGAAYDVTRWNTLSWTSWQLQARSSVFSVAFLAGLAVLLFHVVLRWPNRSKYQPPQGDEHR